MNLGFYWLLEGALAGCARPGVRGQRDLPEGTDLDFALDQDLGWLRTQGIGAVVSLTETPLDRAAVSRSGLEIVHMPVPDLTPPLPDQLLQALTFIDRQRSLGRGVAVHCLMGQGRTGTVLAAYLIRRGSTADAAIDTVRARCVGAIGSVEQERALRTFAARRDWIF